MATTSTISTETTPLLASTQKPYSVFSPTAKRLIILTATLASSFSPLSANIYYPALNALAKDLNVSSSQINLTITTYMICQGLAPTFLGSFADRAGRRPAYILCFLVYIAGNIALALQHNYVALLVLRAVQSSGSSGTVALASAVAADIITSAERGVYMGITSLGNILAPSLGPILGGILSEYLGWPAIFWFLAIAAAAFFIPLLLFFPETCRALVGDGSTTPPHLWNQPLLSQWYLGKRNRQEEEPRQNSQSDGTPNPSTAKKLALPNPLASLRLLFHLPTGLILLSNGIVFASYYAVMAGIPSQFKQIYGLTDLGIGFTFIPVGLGSLISATFNGAIVDWNYRRILATTGTTHVARPKSPRPQPNGHATTIPETEEDFPIERARLQIGGPMTIASASIVLIYGVCIDSHPPLPVALALTFVVSFCLTAAYNVMNVLLVDLYYTTPATAMAANNLVRCFLGAASTAAVHPMIVRWGNRITYAFVAGAIGAVCPLLSVVYHKGAEWRRQRTLGE
ncbi:hypothetical protein ARAM_000515 [Aspergillus rambellii]|uniref:Major facilitator superfamily (MFS) profile domain-containing protein n=1 Tax=Aspergillus rambellii TaxID=308745 RepID=A0A0F8WFH8_9EURO|nr:hypothetical protein ARAM_000515 [Aspergillus rambellii]